MQMQADKRALDDLDLPNQLTFDFRRGLDTVTLNLKRNYDIDPNADIYVVQKLKNGRSFLAKTNELENEAFTIVLLIFCVDDNMANKKP
ncbi:hypothetical protein CHS0354_027043 [Potamilus streckersoni]|uniref:Uncharacterized protein n=1 Tax=Potamilus streckersoni TaxID=2493646 RepID=A0AAE0RMP5_9BIVA|nr:hypothetical protein CHS0354_027043 [Potamilus streckersoni]